MSLFRPRSDKFWMDPRVSSRDSTSTSAASPSLFSKIFAGKRRKQSKQFYSDDSTIRVRSRHRRVRRRSPDLAHDAGGDGCEDDCDRGTSSCSPPPPPTTPSLLSLPGCTAQSHLRLGGRLEQCC